LDIHDLVKIAKRLFRENRRIPSRVDLIKNGVSDWQLRKISHSEIIKASGLKERIKPKIKKPNILLIDIETAPITAYIWGLFDQNVALNQIKDDWFILSWSAKWLGEKEIFYADQRNEKKIENDKKILIKLRRLLDKADIVIGHNSKKFDIKKINARLISHGIKHPSSFRQIDTLSISRKYFSPTSHKLEYIAKMLKCKNKKMVKRKFNGFELWSECLKKNIKAFKEMEKYNKKDVLVLEEVYKKLIPLDSSINFSILNEANICPCGCADLRKYSYAYTNTGKFARYKCAKCFREVRGKENLLSKELRSTLFK
jgi:uncharacterized protein YprB with RNaseH-like and TPR domain